MIDYYLLEAEISFCVYKNSCHVVWKFAMCPFWLQLVKWHSYTSDMHCLWTMLKQVFILRMLSLVSSFLEVLFFFSHPLALSRLPPFSTQVCQWTSVPGQVSFNLQVQSLTWISYSSYLSSGTRLFHNVFLPSPQPESAAVGMSITANSPFSKRKRECACLQGFTLHGCCTQVTWQLA